LAALLAIAPAAHAPSPASPAGLELFDLAGRSERPLAAGDWRAFVFVLVRTDCPIANRYAPELQRLHRRFGAAGIEFRLVYPDAAEAAPDIRRHLEQFGFRFGALRDPRQHLVRLVDATVTPEAAVFVPARGGPRLAYRGRIDDRYVDFGTARPAPKERDLERVLEAIVAGEAPASRTTPAVGCFISRTE
jgi:hypothetical protein